MTEEHNGKISVYIEAFANIIRRALLCGFLFK